jgi:LEA14-like dessication related protein
MMRLITIWWCLAAIVTFAFTMSSCNLLEPELKSPKVELGTVRLGKTHGLSQIIDVELLITNMNDRDLNVRSMHYEIGIDKLSIFSGDAANLPTLAAHQATSIHLEISANLLQMLQLIEHLSHQSASEQIIYQLKADLDFSAWLPTLHVDKKGVLSLKK